MFVMRLQVGLFHTQHVSTLELLSDDIFTKALGKSQFLYLMRKFGIYDPQVPI